MNLPRLRLPTRGLIRLPLPVLLAVAVLVAGGTAFALIGPLVYAGPQGDGTSVTTNGWFVTPAGRQVQLGERPYGAAMSPDGRTLLASNDGQWMQSLQVVDTASGNVVQTISYKTGVTHVSYDTTSVLATIERRWGVAALGTRDAAVDDFTALFAGRR